MSRTFLVQELGCFARKPSEIPRFLLSNWCLKPNGDRHKDAPVSQGSPVTMSIRKSKPMSMKTGSFLFGLNALTALLIATISFPRPDARAGAQPLTPVTDNNWGLKIVVFDVGQGDGALLLTPNGQAAIIDMGRKKSQGEAIAAYLLSQTENGIASIDTVEFLFASHYDRDHIAGARGLQGKIKVKAAFDQGPSAARDPSNAQRDYTAYVKYVGDKNGNGIKNSGENNFIRNKAEPGQVFNMGLNGNVTITILSVRGDTAGTANDLALTRDTPGFDENPGSIIQLVTLGDFEYLTTGDATSKDWKADPIPRKR
jgi:glyoxylase-like metal-dependent hydrolase (beta-lactamase superfamily II)